MPRFVPGIVSNFCSSWSNYRGVPKECRGTDRFFVEAGAVDPVVVRGRLQFIDKTHLFRMNALISPNSYGN